MLYLVFFSVQLIFHFLLLTLILNYEQAPHPLYPLAVWPQVGVYLHTLSMVPDPQD